MNRKQRRRSKQPKERVYTLKESDMERYAHSAAETIFYTMVAIGCITIYRHFPKLIKVEVDGKNRMERFFDYYQMTYQEWSDGHITDTEIQKFMTDHVGIKR